MALPSDHWFTVADAIRDAVVAGYATAAVDLPDRRVITYSTPVADCEMLAVQLERCYGITGDPVVQTIEPIQKAAGFAMRGATYAVWLLRCVPEADLHLDQMVIPTVADEEAAAEAIMVDAQLLLNVLAAATKAGDLPGCNSLAFEDWQNIEASAGLGGGVLRIRVGTS